MVGLTHWEYVHVNEHTLNPRTLKAFNGFIDEIEEMKQEIAEMQRELDNCCEDN